MNDSPMMIRKVRDFGSTVSDTFSFLRDHWLRLAILYALFVVPFLLLATLLGADAFPSVFEATSRDVNQLWQNFTKQAPVLLLSALAYIIGSTLYPALVYLYMRKVEESNGKQPSIRECTERLIPKTLLCLAYILLLILGLSVGALIVFLPVIGVLAYVPAVIWLMVCFTILTPVLTVEDQPFPNAFKRSIRLVTGRWWYTLGIVVLFGIICYFLSSVIGFVVSMITGMASINFLDLEKDLAKIFDRDQILLTGLSFILQQVFYLVLHVGMGIHYYSLVEEKDARGLEARLDSLGKGGSASSHSHLDEQY